MTLGTALKYSAPGSTPRSACGRKPWRMTFIPRISAYRPKHVIEFVGQPIDYVLTVCDHAHETCPVFPGGTKTVHHSFVDPAAFLGSDEERLELFRKVRDQIRDYLRTFPPPQ